jgi:hypothetical protein
MAESAGGMTTQELDILTRGLAPALKDAIAKANEPLLAKIAILEQRLASIRDGRDGLPGVAGPAGERGQQGDKGIDGSRGTDGRDGINGKDGAPGPEGQKGERGEIGPVGERGEMGPRGEKGDPGDVGAVGPQGPQGDRGEIGPMGPVGPAGERGDKGMDGAPGRDGLHGKDGLGFDGLSFEIRDDGAYAVFERGDVKKELRLPVPIYRDVWKENTSYFPGDTVTWGGSAWIAKQETTAKPGLNTPESRAWRLCVKKGADGKGLVGPAGPQGPRGEKGERGPERW